MSKRTISLRATLTVERGRGPEGERVEEVELTVTGVYHRAELPQRDPGGNYISEGEAEHIDLDQNLELLCSERIEAENALWLEYERIADEQHAAEEREDERRDEEARRENPRSWQAKEYFADEDRDKGHDNA